jgi:hypothetical protein
MVIPEGTLVGRKGNVPFRQIVNERLVGWLVDWLIGWP